VRQSRMLQAPLAREAGGWGRCEQDVFRTAEDADYQVLLASLSRLSDELAQHPREDLLSIRGTPAGEQIVALPVPPPRRPPEREVLEGDWVYLSDLKWESAKAGWSPNGDGLPRLNRSIEETGLLLGGKRYGKGIGTHAPSEILYRLGGQYDALHAVIGGAEDRGTVLFEVYGDDRLLYESPLMHGLREAQAIEVSTADVDRLRLVVTDGGDGYGADCANWAGARVRRRAQ
jgi:NPCBM/NEW2 domain